MRLYVIDGLNMKRNHNEDILFSFNLVEKSRFSKINAFWQMVKQNLSYKLTQSYAISYFHSNNSINTIQQSTADSQH